MAFQKGQSGNPNGKPKGTRHRVTMAADGSAALHGSDLSAEEDRSVRFRLPSLDKVEDAVAAHAAIVAGVAIGDLTPSEAGDLARLVDNYTRAVEGHGYRNAPRAIGGGGAAMNQTTHNRVAKLKARRRQPHATHGSGLRWNSVSSVRRCSA